MRVVFSACFARRAVAALSRQKSRFLCEVRWPPCLRLELKYAQWRLMTKGRKRQSWWTSVAIRHIREAFFRRYYYFFFNFPNFLFFLPFRILLQRIFNLWLASQKVRPPHVWIIRRNGGKKKKAKRREKSACTEQYHEHVSIFSTRLTMHLATVRIHWLQAIVVKEDGNTSMTTNILNERLVWYGYLDLSL